MIYDISLQTAGFVTGIVLLLHGLSGLILGTAKKRFLVDFPRSRAAGIILLTIALIWSFWLLATMQMGEFSGFRMPLLVALPISYLLVLKFMEEFLAVRALGMVFLLAAEPLLAAAFFRDEPSRLFVTVFAYILILKGLIWVMLPYLLRDKIAWAVGNSAWWRFSHFAAAAYGGIVLVLALTQY
jgi:hypothetical protein